MMKATFPITISKGDTYFSDARHQPFLWQGDTCWRLFWQYSFEEARIYLQDRAEHGFSVIQVHLLPLHTYQANRYGDKPFLLDGDITSINPAYFDYVEKVLQYGKSLGLTFAISPMWLSTWEQDWHRYFHGQAALDYSTFVAERYQHLDHIIAWIHGGDDDAIALHPDIKDCALIYKQITPNVANTYHAGIGGGWAFFGEESWFDFGMAYTYDAEECQRQFVEFKKRYPDKPVLLGETHYEGNRGIGAEIIRYYAYHSLILGGSGQTYGHKDIWMGTMFWEMELCSAASHHLELAQKIWQTLDWPQMKPDIEGKELITVRSKMPHAKHCLIPTAVHQKQQELIAYVSDFRWFKVRRPVQKGKWIDPVSGQERNLKWIQKDILQIPGQNAGNYHDWLLHLQLDEVT